MTTAEKVAALQVIYAQLDELLTPEEFTAYPTLQHLEDLISDLELE
jgi:hypothetical protein